MSCSQTINGLSLNCDSSKGGIKVAYVAPYNKVSGVTVSGDMITAISGVGEFVKFEFKKNTGNFTSTLNVDSANGVNYVSTELTLQFLKMETVKRIEMSALALSDMAVVVVDANGKGWYLGFDNAVTASAGTGETGTAATDGNKYSITLLDESDTWPYEVSADVLASLD